MREKILTWLMWAPRLWMEHEEYIEWLRAQRDRAEKLSQKCQADLKLIDERYETERFFRKRNRPTKTYTS